ncbi:MAG: hypothetical protein FWG45_03955 [Oscillospiraceae bacterium]|nr:hypothetical protein [Oscillospiraceae bacterium]
MKWVETSMNVIEIAIAFFLMLVILVRWFEIGSYLFSDGYDILNIEFNQILSLFLGLIIGIEFAKMLCKHTSESVVDVLLFTLARHVVIYNDNKMINIIIGVAAIIALFAAKKYLLNYCAECEARAHEESIKNSECEPS